MSTNAVPPCTQPRANWYGVDVWRVATTAFGKRSRAGRLLDGISFLVMVAVRLLFLPRPDLVVSLTSPPLLGFVAAIYARARRVHFTHWLMDLNIDAAIALGQIGERSLLGRVLLWGFRYSLSQSDRVIVEDRFTGERAILRGADPNSIVLIPCWPAHDTLPPEQEQAARAAFRSEYGLGDAFVVMYSGNHAAVHPLDTLLEAARRLDGQGFLFLFVGGGDRVSDVTSAVRHHTLRDVKQLPLQPRNLLASSLAAADLHVIVMGNIMNGLGHPSKMYGVLATGSPYVFIGPKESFAGDILAECPYGFAVEHGDVDGLVTVLRRAKALRPEERQAYREANRAYARRFSRDRALAIFDAAVSNFVRESTKG